MREYKCDGPNSLTTAHLWETFGSNYTLVLSQFPLGRMQGAHRLGPLLKTITSNVISKKESCWQKDEALPMVLSQAGSTGGAPASDMGDIGENGKNQYN